MIFPANGSTGAKQPKLNNYNREQRTKLNNYTRKLPTYAQTNPHPGFEDFNAIRPGNRSR